MTTSTVQASCAVDVVVCDDTVSTDLTGLVGIGVLILLLALAAVVFVLRTRRR